MDLKSDKKKGKMQMTDTLYREAARLYVRYAHYCGPVWAEGLLMDYLPANHLDGRVRDIPVAQLPAFMDTIREKLDTPQETV